MTNYIPLAEFFELDNLYILYMKPLTCILLQQDNLEHFKFEGLNAKIVPVFPLERSITVKGYLVYRTQVPICPVFSLTDNKVQGSTLTNTVLDLKYNPSARG